MSYGEKPNYRIYALVIGEVIPPGNFFGCEIRKMTFGEQKSRNFSPIQSSFSEIDDPEFYPTYATSLPYIDPILIKSEYVIICDIEERDEKAALGGAIGRIDRICRFLTFAYSEDFKNKFNRDRNLEPYLYQVNKIYSLDQNGSELEIDFKLESGHIYLPKRPELNEWRHQGTQKFLQEIFNFHDNVLERATKYLYRSSIGSFIKDSPEKIALDHIKSIEIIINSLSNEREFWKRVKEAAIKINLTSEEQATIHKCWEDRSKYSDTAHPSPHDQAERYPNQFPIPSNVHYPHWFTNPVAVNVCLKYFFYRKSIFQIDIGELDGGEKEKIGVVNPQWESNHLFFETSERSKEKLKRKLVKAFTEEYNIVENDILDIIITPGTKSIILRVKL